MLGGASNTEYVNYSLYSNPGYTTNWGNTIGTDTVTGTGYRQRAVDHRLWSCAAAGDRQRRQLH